MIRTEGLAAGLEAALRLLDGRDGAVIAVDGRCAAGKSTFGALLAKSAGASLFHMDDFFLRPEQRTAARCAEPGGNADRERFRDEVLLPLQLGRDALVRPFDCGSGTLGAPVRVPYRPFAVVEGTYCLHPALRSAYDLRVFLTTDPETQLGRLRLRCGGEPTAFTERWIPLEEAYFRACRPEAACDLLIAT